MTEAIDVIGNVTARQRFGHDGNEEMLMSITGYISAAVVLFLIGFFGFFFNLGVIILMWKDKQLWTPLNIILFNLICSDFSVSIFGNPWTLASAVSYHWIFGELMCQLYAFFMALLGIGSMTTLAVLAFERYLIVSRPFRNHGLTKTGAIYLVFGIWIYSLTLTAPPLLGWGKFVNEAANISCSVNWEEHSFNAMTYILYLFAFGLVIPLGIIIFSYINIILQMKKNQLSVGQTTKAEKRVTFMVLLMIVAYLVAWLPYSVCALLVQFGDPSLVTPSVAVVPALLAKSSICYNPIIYVGLNSHFREVIKQLLGLREEIVESNCETHALGVSRIMSSGTETTKTTTFCNPYSTRKLKEHTFIFQNFDKRMSKLAEESDNKPSNCSEV